MWMPPVYGIVWQGCPSSVACGDSFPLRGSLLTKTPPHLAARGLKFNFYCSFALMAASIARAASLPAPIARMTVAAPVTASPPA